MDKIIASLRRYPKIANIIEIKLTLQAENKIRAAAPELLRPARHNARHITVHQISYLSQGLSIRGFIVTPRTNRRLPVIVFNRGGGGRFGSLTSASVFCLLSTMARWGYVVFASQYRGGIGSQGKDEIGGADLNDVLNLYPIIKSHPHSDIKRIGIFGGSRGGMMAYLMLKARVDWIKAVVNVAGMANLVRDVKSFRVEMKEYYRKIFGNSLKELKNRSAIYWAYKFPKNVPILLMHGSSDWRVNPEDSIDLSKEFLKHRIPHRLVIFEGADHEISEFKEESLEMAKSWFHKYVRDLSPLPKLKPHGD